ncbi:hypothetical protein L7H23_01230 [Sphingopyxis sp. BSN-002]|uniref:hypothetical protein n=1 Tax=Sphingopyxis sp. BSN-002 TaxID=2911495 RepID=UPI001EDB5F41|nr:hypothetical protein [Sphingopyxis sp. BSN-002]QVJ07699.1 hypothetical protein [Sphingopyxis phage VSN-002]UKK84755.1 hypothetical protein L7H23_01230 [Sphingopyxis sp. BSN-002]
MSQKVRDKLDRRLLGEVFNNPRMIRAMEAQAQAVDVATEGLSTQAEATEAIQDASVIVLASNAAFSNERILELGQGLSGVDEDGKLKLSTSSKVPIVNGDFTLLLTLAGDTTVAIPLGGILATVANVETFSNKTLAAPKIDGLGNYADDTAAAAGGVPVKGIYRTGSILKTRVA